MKKILIVLLALFGLGGVASAQPVSDNTKKLAAAHFRLGEQYREAEEWDKAIQEYLAAYGLVPKPVILYDVALAYQKKGDKRNELKYLQDFLAKDPTDADAVADAKAQVAILEPQIAQEDATKDTDGDGIVDSKDKCPNDPEDKDGFQDEDGCPDLDNDGDGIPDKTDKCPNQPEDKDGFQDDDGCPDPDNDGDGVPDVKDKCPNVPGNGSDGCISNGNTLRTAGIATMGAGGALVIVGIALGAAASGKASAISNDKGGVWSPTLADDLSTGRTLNRDMTIFVGLGVATVIAGGVVYYVGVKQHHPESPTKVGIGPGSIVVWGRW